MENTFSICFVTAFQHHFSVAFYLLFLFFHSFSLPTFSTSPTNILFFCCIYLGIKSNFKQALLNVADFPLSLLSVLLFPLHSGFNFFERKKAPKKLENAQNSVNISRNNFFSDASHAICMNFI